MDCLLVDPSLQEELRKKKKEREKTCEDGCGMLGGGAGLGKGDAEDAWGELRTPLVVGRPRGYSAQSGGSGLGPRQHCSRQYRDQLARMGAYEVVSLWAWRNPCLSVGVGVVLVLMTFPFRLWVEAAKSGHGCAPSVFCAADAHGVRVGEHASGRSQFCCCCAVMMVRRGDELSVKGG